MTKNKLMMINKVSGRNVHRFLIKESYRIFAGRGYGIQIEYLLENGKRADLFAKKKEEEIVIECLVRPNLKILEKKKENYKNYKLVITYPSKFIPTFPIDQFVDEVIEIDIPPKLLEKSHTKPIEVSEDLWVELAKRRSHPDQTFEDVIINLIGRRKLRKWKKTKEE